MLMSTDQCITEPIGDGKCVTRLKTAHNLLLFTENFSALMKPLEKEIRALAALKLIGSFKTFAFNYFYLLMRLKTLLKRLNAFNWFQNAQYISKFITSFTFELKCVFFSILKMNARDSSNLNFKF